MQMNALIAAATAEAPSGWLAKLSGWVDTLDGYVWGVPLIAAILVTGLILTFVLRLRHVFNLKNAFRIMFSGEEGGGATGEVSQFGALCTALSATIGTGNIVGVATAIGTGGPGALFWMEVAAFFGMYELAPGFLLALAATVVVSLATKRPSAEMIAEFESVDRE